MKEVIEKVTRPLKHLWAASTIANTLMEVDATAEQTEEIVARAKEIVRVKKKLNRLLTGKGE